LRPLADSVLAGPRELELAAKAAHAINDPVAAGYEARLRSPQLQATRQLAGTAQAAMNKGDLAAAINAYSRIPGYDGDAEVLKRMAFASSNAGRADDALRFADRALSLEPRNPDMLHMAGMVRLNSGRDRDAARRLLQQAIELDPANRVFRGDLAKAQATKG
jgi:tetratricopeptide (TPR) repeat protein